MVGFVFLCAVFLAFALPSILRAIDSNGDNLPDAWESNYGITTNAYDATNLVGWWQMEPNTNNEVLDRSTNQLNGILTNFASSPYVSGLFGDSLSFTTNAQASFPTNAALNTAANQFTFSTWFQSTNAPSSVATVATWTDVSTNSWSLQTSTNGAAYVSFATPSSGSQVIGPATSAVQLYDGTWHQVAVTYDTNQVATVYVDGVTEAVATVTNWASASAASFTFGVPDTNSTNPPYNLDEVRLYNRALATQEVSQLPVTYSDLNGSGLTVFEDYVESLDPLSTSGIVTSSFVGSGLTSYYGSTAPNLAKSSGDAQIVTASTFAANPLVVQVTDGSGNPLIGAPITFAIAGGSDGGLAQTSGGTTTTSLSLTTDGSGNATVYYQSGAEVLQNNIITATAVDGSGSISVSFQAYCGVQNGLASWLDADTGVTADSGENVSAWKDQTANGNTALQATSGIQPTLLPASLQNHGVIHFDGSSTYLGMPACIPDDFTMVVVFRSSVGTGSGGQWYNAGGIVDAETSGVVNDFGLSLDQDGNVLAGVGNPDTTCPSTTGGYNDNRGHIATFIRTESSGSFSEYMDSVLQGSQSGNTNPLTDPPQITIGATQTLANYFGGDVAEVLLYSRNLSSDEQAQIEGYLADKYGLYSANATWPMAYSSDVQAQITANLWDKSQADAYVTFISDPPVPAPGLLVWLKASAGVTTDGSGNVVQWVDQSPSGHVLGQNSADGPPSLQTDASGNPTIQFNGGQALYAPDYIPANGDLTIISVSSCSNNWSFSEGVTLGAFPPGSGQSRVAVYSYGTDEFDLWYDGAQGGNSAAVGEEAIHSVTYGRGSGAVNFYLRGVYSGYANTWASDLCNGIIIGQGPYFNGGYFGNISEVLIYNRVLSNSERSQAEGYLADEYGAYDPAATWPLAYGTDVQELILENNWSKAQADAYLASLAGTVRDVTLSPSPGRYATSQAVTVTSATTDATIYYTTDGTTPTTSSASVTNGGQLTVSTTTQFKFLAADTTNSNSSVTTGMYLIGNLGQLVAGDSFTMVNKLDGTVWTWGDDGRGQEGDNQANNPTPFPQQVAGLTGITAVAAAGDHALAVDSTGDVWAWGADDQSQGGDGGTNDLLVPTEISGLTNIVSVAAGQQNGFAIDNGGNLFGWGNNNNGQLGDGTTNGESTPEAITSVTNVTKVVSNPNFTLALESNGTVWATGSNNNGELGDGTQNSETYFQQVPNLTGVIDVAIGWGHALALKSDGTVWSWGNGGDGALGHGNYNQSNSPQQIIGLPPAIAVVAVDSKSFVLLADGTIRSFGNNSQGELGLGADTDQSQTSPMEPAGVTNIALIAAGSSHTVVCNAKGAFYGWGDNSSYRLTEDFAPNNFTTSTEVHDPAWQGFSSVASAEYTTIALKDDGTVWTVGSGGSGTLGQGDYYSVQSPIQATGLTNITRIAASQSIAFAVKGDGTLWAWGGNWDGQLGVGSYNQETTPTQVTIVSNVTGVASGDNHSLVVESNGTVWASGDDSQGELGDSTTNGEVSPIQVSAFSLATQVAAGSNTSYVLQSDGTVWAWGQNDSGQLGLGMTGNIAVPTQITSLPTMVAIAAHGNNAAGIDSSGNVWTWGQLGNGDGTPAEQSGLSGVISIATGSYHLLAKKSDGTVWGLGANFEGQLGTLSYNVSSFTQLPDVQGATGLAACYGSSLIVKQDGTIAGLGSCTFGQLAGNMGVAVPVPKPLFGIAMLETPPSVSITSPSSGATGTEGTSILLQSSAAATVGSITEVDYYLNGVQIGSATGGGTWDCSWAPTTSGDLTFLAVARDTAGVAQASAPVTVSVAYSSATLVAPRVSLASGTYASAQTVTISTPTIGAAIYYTQNGLDPTTASTPLGNGGQITVSATSEYKFMAVSASGSSTVTSATYTIGTTSGNPPAPSNFWVSFGPSGQANLSWSAVSANTSGEEIQEQNADGTWSTIATLSPDQTSYSVSGVIGTSPGLFQMIAEGALGESSPISGTPPKVSIPPYIALDLGAGLIPVKITNSGIVLLRDLSGNYYRWQDGSIPTASGTSVPLSAPTGYTILNFRDMGEDGTVIADGMNGTAAAILIWNPSATVASPTTEMKTSGGAPFQYISSPLAGLTNPNIWSDQDTATAGDGFYDSNELGTLSYNVEYYPPDEEVGGGTVSPGYYSGYALYPSGVASDGSSVCTKTDYTGTLVTASWWLVGYPDDFYPGNYNTSPTVSTVRVSPAGTVLDTLPWYPISLNSQGDAIGGPSGGPIVYWDGDNTSMPANFTPVCLNGMQDSDGDADYQILGMYNGQAALISMDPYYGDFEPQTPVKLSDNIIGGGWNGFAFSKFFVGNYLVQVLNDSGAIVGTATKTSDSSSHGVMLVAATIMKVISNQFTGLEFNELPTGLPYSDPVKRAAHQVSDYNNPMIMACNSGTTANLSLDIRGIPPGLASKFLVGIRQAGTTTILASTPVLLDPTRTLLQFPANNGAQKYQVVIGYDTNGSGVLDPSEVSLVYAGTGGIDPPSGPPTNQDKVYVTTQNDYTSAVSYLNGYTPGSLSSLLFPNAAALTKTFLDSTTAPLCSAQTTFTLYSNDPDLKHPLGASWTASGSVGSATANFYTFDSTTSLSADVSNSYSIKSIILGQMAAQKATVLAYFTANPTATTYTSSTIPYTAPSFSFSTLDGRFSDVFNSLGSVDTLQGHFQFTATKSTTMLGATTINVTALSFDGSLTDLYDFYFLSSRALLHNGAMAQAGYPALGTSGRVFESYVTFSVPTTSYTYQFQ